MALNLAVGDLAGMLAVSNVPGANGRIRIGIVGPGARASEILSEALSLPNVECAGACRKIAAWTPCRNICIASTSLLRSMRANTVAHAKLACGGGTRDGRIVAQIGTQ